MVQNHPVGNRWYDQYPELAECLEGLKNMDHEMRDTMVRDILKLIRSRRPDLLEAGRSLEFPLDLHRRRWYDRDPYTWLAVNTLRLGNSALHASVIEQFHNHKEAQAAPASA